MRRLLWEIPRLHSTILRSNETRRAIGTSVGRTKHRSRKWGLSEYEIDAEPVLTGLSAPHPLGHAYKDEPDGRVKRRMRNGERLRQGTRAPNFFDEVMMTVVLREVVDGWLIAMNDEVGKRAAPGAVFRMGRMSTDGLHPVVETLQPGWSSGAQYFVPFKDEAEVREFLLGLGFTELPRWTPGTPLLSLK